ncbi:MAG: CDP-alcohol phosphatidyltransferase family protein [Acidimicrobiales bacterium]
MRTRITPNAVTLMGLLVHLAVAGYVVTLRAPVSGISVAIVLVGWQLAFALDCTDGQLARERGVASPFGAWLDQLADYIAHVAVYLSLGLFLVRSLQLEATMSAVLVCVISAANVFQLFASAERNVLMGTGGGIHLETKGWVRALGAVRHFSDYGAILLIASVLLLLPKGLLVFVIATGVLAVGTVVGQVGYNWARIATPRA